jgi:enamine deaminase RidA (YjgF/YER057c/UK114 family)
VSGSPEASEVEQRLLDLGYSVPGVVTPLASYVPALGHGDLTYSSGQLPLVEGSLHAVGKVGPGGDVSLEQAQECARLCALNAVAAVKSVVGDLDRVTQVVKVTGFVASDPAFTDQHLVLNGASELLGHAFGPAGVHARSAVGVAVLPMNSPVEVEVVVSTGPTDRVDEPAGR